MKQLKVWSQFFFSSDTVGRVLLEARAGQVVHIFGCKLDLHSPDSSDYQDKGDAVQVHSFLQAAPRAPLGSGGIAFNTTTLDAYMRSRSILAYLGAAEALTGPTNIAVVNLKANYTTGWLPLDFEVPGLWMVGSQVNTATARAYTGIYTVLFDWVTRSPLQIAALYTSYGIDAVDATEREATGNINFNESPGSGPLVGGVLG